MHYFSIDKQRSQCVVTLQTLFIVSTRYALWKFSGCNNSASDTADIGAMQPLYTLHRISCVCQIFKGITMWELYSIRLWLKINWSEWNCGLISAIFQVLSRAKQCPWVLVCRNRVCWAAEQASFSSSRTKIAFLVKHWHWLQKVWTFSSLMSDTCQLWRASLCQEAEYI